MMVSKNPQDWKINNVVRPEPHPNAPIAYNKEVCPYVFVSNRRAVNIHREKQAARTIQSNFRRRLMYLRVRGNIETKKMNNFTVKKVFTRVTDCETCIDMLSLPFEKEQGVCINCYNRGLRAKARQPNIIWMPPHYINNGIARFPDGKGGFSVFSQPKVPINCRAPTPKRGYYEPHIFNYVIKNLI